jgi:hypothetical protein
MRNEEMLLGAIPTSLPLEPLQWMLRVIRLLQEPCALTMSLPQKRSFSDG